MLLADLRHALRVFRTYPGVTTVAILSLAVGIGANSIMFSIVDGMYLRPLPVRDPAGLVWIDNRMADGRSGDMAWLDYRAISSSAPAFADVAAQSRRGGILDNAGELEQVLLTVVSDNYFSLLGVEAARGRLFRPDLDANMAEPAIAISDSLWRRRFGADPSLVGRSIRLNGRAYTVVGLMPPEFHGLMRGVRNDVWVPVSTWKAMGNSSELEGHDPYPFEAMARLRPGANLRQAQAQLDALTARLQQDYPRPWRGRRLAAEQSPPGQVPPRERTLLAATCLLLLIACANVAMLLLAQAERRQREMGIRVAVGAGRARLAAQLFTESALLAVAGTVVALLLAAWMIPLVPVLLPPGPDFISYDIKLDGRVLLLNLVSCILTVLLFGLAPSLAAARTDVIRVLRGGTADLRRRYAGRNLLAVAQAALGVVLLTCAGLLARSFLYTQAQRPASIRTGACCSSKPVSKVRRRLPSAMRPQSGSPVSLAYGRPRTAGGFRWAEAAAATRATW